MRASTKVEAHIMAVAKSFSAAVFSAFGSVGWFVIEKLINHDEFGLFLLYGSNSDRESVSGLHFIQVQLRLIFR